MLPPIEDHKWHDLSEYGARTRLPPGHRIEYALVLNGGEGIVVRIAGPNAHVFGCSTAGKEALDKAMDIALAWFESVGREL